MFEHTAMALDAAVQMKTGEPAHDLQLMFGVLCRDFGKPATTVFEEGRWRSPAHEEAGVGPTTAFLERMRAPQDLASQVEALVAEHLAPVHSTHPKSAAGPCAYRRLARRLATAGTNIEMLAKVAHADHFGRTTEESIRRADPTGDEFLARAQEFQVSEQAEPDVVMGRHLIAR